MQKKGGVKGARHLEGGARPADHCMRMLTWKIARNDECTIIIVAINRQMDIRSHFQFRSSLAAWLHRRLGVGHAENGDGIVGAAV